MTSEATTNETGADGRPLVSGGLTRSRKDCCLQTAAVSDLSRQTIVVGKELFCFLILFFDPVFGCRTLTEMIVNRLQIIF